MLRFRRYRVFLFFTACAIFAFYRFGRIDPSYWENPAHSVNVLKDQLNYSGKNTQQKQQQEVFKPNVQDAKKVDEVKPKPVKELGKPKAAPTKELPPPVASITKPVQQAPAAAKTFAASTSTERIRVMPNPIPPGAPAILEQGSGRWESDQLPIDIETIEWEPVEEHFPVPSGSTIALPTGSPKPMPKLQAKFEKETQVVRADRIKKRDAVKEAFLHAWKGYKEKAWGRDELMPISGSSKDPFNGWGATLIDSLDTMWIMGLTDEFEEALEMVKKTNFKTSRRSDIPIFETTIRYLGGLLGAYDVSEGKYKILLDKAVELGDIMIGSFDTPNRMPDTFYQWKPTFASNPHRASTRVVLAELGSLALEFTRLAQLTKESKFYDAVARIADALEEWQDHTRLPGLWPTYVDASGCERVVYKSPNTQVVGSQTLQRLKDWKGNPVEELPTMEQVNAQKVAHSKSKGPSEPLTAPRKERPMGKQGRIAGWDKNHPEDGDKATKENDDMEPIKLPDPLVFEAKDPEPTKTKTKRQLGNLPEDDEPIPHPDNRDNDPMATMVEGEEFPASIPKGNIPPPHAVASALPTKMSLPECVPHGLNSQSSWGTDEYTLGSMADSTYEYFPKMHLMLGGLTKQYQKLYETAIDVAKKNLLFRVMIPDEKREILVSGSMHVSVANDDNSDPEYTYRLAHGGSHLTCFVGGMFAMGAKLFDRKEDMDIAAKLTDGCVWAYEMTASGIMPETFTALACDDRKDCKWNETKWWDELDPNPQYRWDSYDSQIKFMESQIEERKSAGLAAKLATKAAAPVAKATASVDDLEEPESVKGKVLKSPSDLSKRQLAEDASVSKEDVEAIIAKPAEEDDSTSPTSTTDDRYAEPVWQAPTVVTDDAPPPIYSPDKPMTHEEYAKNYIKEERLPPGIVSMPDRRYILRPEALESVFYMHRLTGDPYWRRAGWNMVASILAATPTKWGHAAVDDVTKQQPQPQDTMESFWLAETLKYAYLIFDEEDRWSLDDWILNTEAHLLKRVK
ncbi:hypothetical protein EG328_000175 [Venturia inaequalis]|uniref:alpha-1,2-Mannosidase n=1 Tax=Venturia inaequalis TaxID=5025 RepID=A0A8H3VJV8_VENIN|nr:hypothetical protein EG328_000175 [Venturia inaequalis]